MKTVKKGTTTMRRKFFSGLSELGSIFWFLLLLFLLCCMGHMMQLKFKQLKACLSQWDELTERQTMQTLHKFPKLNQQQHAEQFELKPNSNQTHQLTMPLPTTHTYTQTAQNDGECFVSVRLQPHFAQILTHVRRPERGGAAKPNQRLWPLDDL